MHPRILAAAIVTILISGDATAARTRICKISTDDCHDGQTPPRIGVSITLVKDQAECSGKAESYFSTTCNLDANPAPAHTLPRAVKAEFLGLGDATQSTIYCVADSPSGSTCTTVAAPDSPYLDIDLGEPAIGVIRYDNWYAGNNEQEIL